MESYLGLRSPEGTKGVQKGSRESRRDQGGAGGTKGVHEGPKDYNYSPRGPSCV